MKFSHQAGIIVYLDMTVRLLDIFPWRDFLPHRSQNDSWPTQTLDRQVPGMELTGPLHPVLKGMMFQGSISRLIYKYIPAGSAAVARVLPLTVAYVEKDRRKRGSQEAMLSAIHMQSGGELTTCYMKISDKI